MPVFRCSLFPAYFRAIGPMYGISQRDPENALIIAITMTTRKASCDERPNDGPEEYENTRPTAGW